MNTAPGLSLSPPPVVWSLSGADCSGGAGIQADMKTAYSIGLHCCQIITANTTQNQHQFIAMNATELSVLSEQVGALILSNPPAVIKVGMLANVAQIVWLTQTIPSLKKHYPALKIVVDPVLRATVSVADDGVVQERDVIAKAWLSLLTLIDLVTPNYQEAKTLYSFIATDTLVCNVEDSTELAQFLSLQLGIAVVVKGGHIADGLPESHQLMDVLAQKGDCFQVTNTRVNTTYSHGGGCSFAMAMACFFAKGLNAKDALTHSNAFMQKGMWLSDGRVDKYGAFKQPPWPVEKKYYPCVSQVICLASQRYCVPSPALALPAFSSVECDRLGVYPIVDSLVWLARLLPLGLNIIQYRIKGEKASKLPGLVRQAVKMAQQFETRLFINDYWSLAIDAGAYGVHLGQEDLAQLSSDELMQIQASGLRLGLSSHGIFEYRLAAQFNPSYIAMGAIFPTKTKNMTGQVRGVEELSAVVALKEPIPLVAIGGITFDNIQSVVDTKVDSIAVVSLVGDSDNVGQVVASLQEMLTL